MEQNSVTLKSAKVIYEIPDEEVEWEELEAQWANHNDDDVIRLINAGREGLNEGFSNGMKRVNQYIHGTHRGRYYLIGADSGVGKTTIADFMYLYHLWLDCRKRGIKLYVKYFSYEISAPEKKLRWISQWIKHIYSVSLPTDYIAGRIPGLVVTDEHYRMILRAYAVVEEVMKDVQIIDHMLHPTGMLNQLIEHHFEKIGTVIRDEPKGNKKKGMIRAFKPNDPTAITVVITDHLALINMEAGLHSTKSIMDRWSMYSVQLRNIFKAILIQIQQFSTSMQSAYRDKRSESAIAPQRLDFGDSTYTFRDADLVFGLLKPVQFNLQVFHGYRLEDMGQYFLALYIMKNRYGPADRIIPLFINPISGMFYDMPISSSPSINFFIDEAKKIENLCLQFSSPQGQIQ